MRLITRLERAERRARPSARPLLILTLDGGQYAHGGDPLTPADVDALRPTHDLIIVHYVDHWPPTRAGL